MSTIELLYDPRGHTWDSWNALVIEQFSDMDIPALPELEWRDVAQNMLTTDYFSQFGAPGPELFGDWQSWAQSLMGAIN